MKKCAFCAEEIQDEAVKCRFCGEFLSGSVKQQTKWYFRTSVVVIVLLCVGPLGLSLVWLNPRYKIVTKLAVTALIIVVTILFCYLAANIYLLLVRQIEALGVG